MCVESVSDRFVKATVWLCCVARCPKSTRLGSSILVFPVLPLWIRFTVTVNSIQTQTLFVSDFLQPPLLTCCLCSTVKFTLLIEQIQIIHRRLLFVRENVLAQTVKFVVILLLECSLECVPIRTFASHEYSPVFAPLQLIRCVLTVAWLRVFFGKERPAKTLMVFLNTPWE